MKKRLLQKNNKRRSRAPSPDSSVTSSMSDASAASIWSESKNPAQCMDCRGKIIEEYFCARDWGRRRRSSSKNTGRANSRSPSRRSRSQLRRTRSRSPRPKQNRDFDDDDDDYDDEDSDVLYAPQTSSLVVDHTCIAPGYLRKRGKRLGRLEIKYCHVNYVHKRTHEAKVMRELLEILRKNPSLKAVKLAGCFPRDKDDVSDIASAMKSLKHLEELMLMVPEDSNVRFGRYWVPICQSLHSLSLESFDFESKSSMESLVDAIKGARGLRELFLGGHRIKDEGLWQMVKELGYLRRIKKLQIFCCNSLTKISLLVVSSIINWNPNLHVLDLTGSEGIFASRPRKGETNQNNLKLKDVLKTFTQALRNNTSVIEMRLNYCGISDIVFKHILISLEKNETLKVLEVNHNKITRKYGIERHLTRSLPDLYLGKLSLLGLKTTKGTPDTKPWTERQLVYFLDALEQNTELHALKLDDVKEDADIEDILERNASYQTKDRDRDYDDIINSNETVVSRDVDYLCGTCTDSHHAMRRNIEDWMDSMWNR